MAKKTDVFYSLMNITNANILSSTIFLPQNWWRMKPGEVFTKRRTWKLGQFCLGKSIVLENFINSEAFDTTYSMSAEEIWVKEEEIDDLYAVIAFSVLTSFCSYDKQSALIGAFLFQKSPELFLAEDFLTKHNQLFSMLKRLKLGKEFLEFLESFGVLRFSNTRYNSPNKKTYNFSCAELELVSRERKDIRTILSYTKP